MNEQSYNESNRYRIGAVARLTGVSPDTLRIWERRYGAVCPQRSAGGGRLYITEDVARLRLMKRLVDAGDAIREVSGLDFEGLQARAVDAQRLPRQRGSLSRETPCRLVIIGESLSRAVQAAGETLSGITPVALFTGVADFESRAGGVEADVLVVEQATLHEDTAARVIDWLGRSKALHLLVVYRYASADVLLRLPTSKCSALRAPVDPRTLQVHCLSMMQVLPVAPAPAAADGIVDTQPAPPRRYDDEAPAQLATLCSTIRCECPRHLAEFIASLSAFECYSTECESRSPRDAALHAFLHATASHARHMIEDALSRVIEAECIKL